MNSYCKKLGETQRPRDPKTEPVGWQIQQNTQKNKQQKGTLIKFELWNKQ